MSATMAPSLTSLTTEPPRAYEPSSESPAPALVAESTYDTSALPSANGIVQSDGKEVEEGQADNCFEACSGKVKRWDSKVVAYNRKSKQRRKWGTGTRERIDVSSLESSQHYVPTNGPYEGGAGNSEKTGVPSAPARRGETVVQRYIVVVLVAVIYIWVYIVYIWRLCTPMLRQEAKALNTRGAGIVLIVLFNLLWLITVWAWVRAVIEQPGFAEEIIETGIALPPSATGLPPHLPTNGTWQQPMGESIPIEQSALVGAGKTSGDPQMQQVAPSAAVPDFEPKSEHKIDEALPAIIGPIGATAVSRAREASNTVAELPQDSQQQQQSQGILNPTGPQIQVQTQGQQGQGQLISQRPAQFQQVASLLPEPVRMPPAIPLLRESERYCQICRLIKPRRTHHCRKCGRCVLKFDHHCPWVGGCVGARNHKFFWHFLMWTTVFEVFVLLTVAYHFAKGVQQLGQSADGYLISLFALLAWFVVFTGVLLGTHTWLFVHNLSTVEQMDVSRRSAKETLMLGMYFSDQGMGSKVMREKKERGETFGTGPFWQQKERRRIQKGWKRMWGNPYTDANLWWLGNERERVLAEKREEDQETFQREMQAGDHTKAKGSGPWATNWKEVMGSQPLGWIFPIGRSPRDGSWYPINPRFGQDGSWVPRKDWPKELQRDKTL